jgi:carbon monoxide dehydrogenase subunit G
VAGRFEATIVVDRPIEEVFGFLADGENDKKFSPRVLEIGKTTDGPPGVGTIYASTVKDAGMKTKREFKLTEFEPRPGSAGRRSRRTPSRRPRAATTWLRRARAPS